MVIAAGPRVVISAAGSGQGKTTVATGLMAALRTAGDRVAGFKIGPDYIDPGYHALATGRPGRNLDPRLCSPELMLPLLLHGSRTPEPADLSVIEGVMGLYDGQLGTAGTGPGELAGFASTAHVAVLLGAPVIIVLDVSGMSRTAAAVVRGLADADPDLQLAGVILNKVGSPRHRDEVSSALAGQGVPVLGAVPRDAGVAVPSRHLGLVPAAESADAEAAISRLASVIADCVDLDAVRRIARDAPSRAAEPWDPARVVRPPAAARPGVEPVVAVAGGRAFTFRYAETDELLRAAGCRPVIFDPARDRRLPDGTAALYLGGGFPEVHAAELSDNEPLRTQIAELIAAGLPTVAECAGLLYLSRRCQGRPMVGVLPADTAMTDRLTLGYRQATADHDHLLATSGRSVTGHEFHRTAVIDRDPTGPAWLIGDHTEGFALDPSGSGRPTVHASYLHVHWAGHPELAERFAAAAHRYAARQGDAENHRERKEIADHDHGPDRDHVPELDQVRDLEHEQRDHAPVRDQHEPDLDHHGDAEVGDGLVDLAVNVRLTRPPAWLAGVLHDSLDRIAGYPNADEAVRVIAEAHGVAPEQVLPTAGGAEAFTLIAHGVAADRPLVLHPQFTEPEAALRAAGRNPQRLLLHPEDGFALDPARVDPAADLIMIGNPTNPTGVLHPAAALRALRRPGRVLCVDEAFMDAVPGEPESLLTAGDADDLDGVVVLRSLTKTWGLAGLRAGYAVGDAAVIAAMRRHQPPWSVSGPAIAAIVACLSNKARAEADEAAREFGARRTALVQGLRGLGLTVIGEPATPFVLVRGSAGLHGRLRRAGYAVRRGDTFPGLGPDWFRVAVRGRDTTDAFLAALQEVTDGSDHGA